MVPRKVTLEQVARRAGVSKATVSKVLNRRGGTSPETQRHVEATLRELRYVAVTRDRPSSESGAVVAVFDSLFSLYSLRVLEGLVDGTREAGVDLITSVAFADGVSQLTRAWAKRVADRGHAGVVIVTTSIDPEFADACRDLNVPMVAVDSPNVDGEANASIGSDHFRGGMQAVRHLLDQGHRRIAFVGGDPANPGLRERLSGYREALAEHGIAYDPVLVAEDGMGSAGDAVPRLLALPEPPTAIFATNDADAALAVRSIHRSGRSVPADISVVGYDDTYSATPSYPALTTVHTPMRDIGRLAVETVLGLQHGVQPVSPRVQLATELITRESTAAPRPSAVAG